MSNYFGARSIKYDDARQCDVNFTVRIVVHLAKKLCTTHCIIRQSRCHGLSLQSSTVNHSKNSPPFELHHLQTLCLSLISLVLFKSSVHLVLFLHTFSLHYSFLLLFPVTSRPIPNHWSKKLRTCFLGMLNTCIWCHGESSKPQLWKHFWLATTLVN